MKGKIARTVAIIATGSVLSVIGAGVASASPSGDVIGTGSSSSSSVNIAGHISELRAELAGTLKHENFTAMGMALDETKSVVAGLISQRSSISSETVTYATQAQSQSEKVEAALAKVKQRLGGLPDPLTLVSSLLSTLLSTLSSLVSSLLGGVPSVGDVGSVGGVLPLPAP